MSQRDSTTGSAESFVHSGKLHGLVTGVVMAIWGALIAGALGALAGLTLGFLLGVGAMRLLFRAGSTAAGGVYSPSGDTTKYARHYSDIEALVARGRVDDAATAWAHEVALDPENPHLQVQVGDFYLRSRREPAAALPYFRQARTLGAGGDLGRYVQQKLVDLYLDGPLADEGKAMVELRRLVDAFPGTREAAFAQEALAALKAKRQAAG